MAILNDGNVDSINNLTAGEDSKGAKLNFKEDKDGVLTADGTDGKRYSITVTQGKVSVGDIPEKESAKPAAAPAPTNTKK
jgi:hypothetical protein